MTAKELAEILDGREYGDEMTQGEELEAKRSGLVVVFGYSDDGVEFRGAINDEASCFDGGTCYVTKNGLLTGPDCGNHDCEYFRSALKSATPIESVWCAKDSDATWTYKTDIPHETFNIYEDGELYCIGIVFSMDDV